ncbi:MAG: cytochrome c [Rhodospirillales bacterium]|nr:cytochrome c [Rhodospirillales bacterium]
MKAVLLTILSIIVLVVLGAAAFVYFGVFNVAASQKDSAFVYSVLQTARIRSIKVHAAGIEVPGGYNTESRIIGAAGHFVAHCATCHGAPGTKPGDFAKGMNPRPPDLTHVRDRYTPAGLFWIIKNGIKMTGMPSMADDGDPMLWSTVGLLEQLPSMTDEEFNDLWMEAQAQKGEGHGGMEGMGGMGGVDTHGAGGSDGQSPTK